MVRRHLRKRPPPRLPDPIIIENPVDYQLTHQQQQQIILGRGTADFSTSKLSDNNELDSDEDTKELAEFFRPKNSALNPNHPINRDEGSDQIESASKVVTYEGAKDNKVRR